MSQLTLTATTRQPLKPLVEAALNNELRILEAAIQRSERRLGEFEAVHGMDTRQFIERFEKDEFPETLEFVEWIGEYRLLIRLREKADAYRGISIVN
ncbi:MAG: hypothetical protein R2844_13175 [Caldilineales bacterium]